MPSKKGKGKGKKGNVNTTAIGQNKEEEDLDAMLEEFKIQDDADMEKRSQRSDGDDGKTKQPPLAAPLAENTDVLIQDLEETKEFQCSVTGTFATGLDLNGLGGRVLGYEDKKGGRYEVRIHFTGFCLKVPAVNVVRESVPLSKLRPVPGQKYELPMYFSAGQQAKSKHKSVWADPREIYDATISYARQDMDIRKELTKRLRQGMIDHGGQKGCLVMHMYRTGQAAPVQVKDAKELLMPHQTVFRTMDQMEKMYGRCWLSGRSLVRSDGKDVRTLLAFRQELTFSRSNELEEAPPVTSATGYCFERLNNRRLTLCYQEDNTEAFIAAGIKFQELQLKNHYHHHHHHPTASTKRNDATEAPTRPSSPPLWPA